MRSRRLKAFSVAFIVFVWTVKRFENDHVNVFSEMKTQTFENAFLWTGPKFNIKGVSQNRDTGTKCIISVISLFLVCPLQLKNQLETIELGLVCLSKLRVRI